MARVGFGVQKLGSPARGEQIVELKLRRTPRSADRARSLARVSKKREYFKCRPETIGDFAPKLFKLGV